MADKALTIISCQDARARGLKRYFTGKICKYGHVAERFVVSKHCIACHNQLIGVDREKHRANFRRWYAKNRKEQKARSLAWRTANIDYCRAHDRQWKRDNPDKNASYQRNRKARQARAVGSHTADDIAEIHKAQKGKCAYCRVKLTRKNKNVDHIIAISRGGGNSRKNLQLLCALCNSRKNAKDPIDFAQSRGLLL